MFRKAAKAYVAAPLGGVAMEKLVIGNCNYVNRTVHQGLHLCSSFFYIFGYRKEYIQDINLKCFFLTSIRPSFFILPSSFERALRSRLR